MVMPVRAVDRYQQKVVVAVVIPVSIWLLLTESGGCRGYTSEHLIVINRKWWLPWLYQWAFDCYQQKVVVAVVIPVSILLSLTESGCCRGCTSEHLTYQQKVVVAMSPSQREVDLVTDRKEVVAVVRFQHGDEVMRQKYQRCVVCMCPLCDKHREFSTLLWPFISESEGMQNCAFKAALCTTKRGEGRDSHYFTPLHACWGILGGMIDVAGIWFSL